MTVSLWVTLTGSRSWSETLTEWRATEERRVSEQETQLRHFYFFSLLILKLHLLWLRNRNVTFTTIKHTHSLSLSQTAGCLCQQDRALKCFSHDWTGVFFITTIEKVFIYQLKYGQIFIYLFICCSLAWVGNTGVLSVSMGRNNEKKKKSNID